MQIGMNCALHSPNILRYFGLFILEQVFRSLVRCTQEIEGAEVENNKFCLSVHYRNVDEKVGLLQAPEAE